MASQHSLYQTDNTLRVLDDVELNIQYNVDELLALINGVKGIFEKESTLLEVPVPCVIVGDIHGQYDDLIRMFVMTGTKEQTGPTLRRYLFLGDYIDRGPHSLECICCLFAYKLVFPKMFYLLRGNHEVAFINRNYGFYQELSERFCDTVAESLWSAFNDVFDLLPLAALVHGRILCMHGGISPLLNSFDDIRNIKRPVKTMDESALACDLLWSDPVVDLNGFVKNAVRGVSVCFGEDEVLKLCKKLDIDLIVRAHQACASFKKPNIRPVKELPPMMMNGFGFFCKRKMVTVFTAPKYDVEKNNKGAVMTVSKNLKVGFLLLAPVNSKEKGLENFLKSYTKMSSVTGYTPKSFVSNEEEITSYDPTDVYDAAVMRKSSRTEIKVPKPDKKHSKRLPVIEQAV